MSIDLPYINFWLNTVASVGYYIITFFLFYLVRQSQLINPLAFESIDVKKKLFFLINCVQILFGLFVGFCSLTHTMQAVKYHFGETKYNKYLETLILFTNAAIALITSFVAWKVFPLILETFEKLEILEKEKMQLVQVLSACQESIMVMSSSLLILQGNSATKLFFGENFIGSSILEYVWNTSDLNNIKTKLSSMLTSTSTAPFIIEYKAYNINYDSINLDASEREYVWLESSFIRTSNNLTHDVEFTMMTRNIDARKEAESVSKILNESREQNRINEEKLMYINCVAHDLKTPLQSFSFALDILKRSDLRPDQLEVAHEASVSIDLMKLTISQAMYIGKALSGVTASARRTTVSISNIISHVKIIMHGCQPSIVIHYHVSESMCDSIITDEEWVWQMLLNLLTNACKYTDEGVITVYVEEADDEEMLIFKVVDTGIGIAPNKLSTIFDAFNQAQQGQVVGTGLGLFGVRSRAEALGGSCGVWNNNASAHTTPHGSQLESPKGSLSLRVGDVNKGSTFWFKIPYIKDDTHVDASHFSSHDDYDIAALSVNVDTTDTIVDDAFLTGNVSSDALTNDDPHIASSFYRVVSSTTLYSNSSPPKLTASTTNVSLDFDNTASITSINTLFNKSSIHSFSSSENYNFHNDEGNGNVELINTANNNNNNNININNYSNDLHNNSYIVDIKDSDVRFSINDVHYTTNHNTNSHKSNNNSYMMRRTNNNITPQDMIKSSQVVTNTSPDASSFKDTHKTDQIQMMNNIGALSINTLTDNTLNNSRQNYDSIYSGNNPNTGSFSYPKQSVPLSSSSLLLNGHNGEGESNERKPLLSKSEKSNGGSNSLNLERSNYSSRNLEAIVIDDTATIRKLLTRALLQLGFKRVDCYENGSRGLDAMKLRQVDIVFSDVQMPIMTGPEMATRFREFEEQELQSGARIHRQPIVAITANQAELISSTSAMSLFDRICIKPVDMNELSRTVETFVINNKLSKNNNSNNNSNSNSSDNIIFISPLKKQLFNNM